MQRHPLRRQLTDDEGDVGDDERDNEKTDDLRAAFAQPGALERVRHRVRQGDGAERAGEQRSRCHADLHGGQEAVGVLDQPRNLLPAPALLDQRLDLALAKGDERHFGRDEDTLDDDQGEDDEGTAPDRHQRRAKAR